MSAPIVVCCAAEPNYSMASAARESVQTTIGGGGVGGVVVSAAVSGVSCVSSSMSVSAARWAKSFARVLKQSFPAGTRTSRYSPEVSEMMVPPPPLMTPSSAEPSVQIQKASGGRVSRRTSAALRQASGCADRSPPGPTSREKDTPSSELQGRAAPIAGAPRTPQRRPPPPALPGRFTAIRRWCTGDDDRWCTAGDDSCCSQDLAVHQLHVRFRCCREPGARRILEGAPHIPVRNGSELGFAETPRAASHEVQLCVARPDLLAQRAAVAPEVQQSVEFDPKEVELCFSLHRSAVHLDCYVPVAGGL